MFVENVKWFLKFKENIYVTLLLVNNRDSIHRENIYVTLLLVNNRASIHRENIYVTLLLVDNRDSIHRLVLDPYNNSTFVWIKHLRFVDSKFSLQVGSKYV